MYKHKNTKKILSGLAIMLVAGNSIGTTLGAGEPTGITQYVKETVTKPIGDGAFNDQAIISDIIQENSNAGVNDQQINEVITQESVSLGLNDQILTKTVTVENENPTPEIYELNLDGAWELDDEINFVNGAINLNIAGLNGSAAFRDDLLTAISSHPSYSETTFTVSASGASAITFQGKNGMPFHADISVSKTDGASPDNLLTFLETQSANVGTAKIMELNFGGTLEVGDQYGFSINGYTGYITVQEGDTLNDLPIILNNLFNTTAIGYQHDNQDFTSSVIGGVLTLTAKNPGLNFDLEPLTLNREAQNQVSEYSITGTPEVGDVFNITINNNIFSYEVQSNDSLTDIANELISSITTSSGSYNYLSQDFELETIPMHDNSFRINGKTEGVPVEIEFNTTNKPATAKIVSLYLTGTVEELDTYSIGMGASSIDYVVSTGSLTKAQMTSDILNDIQELPLYNNFNFTVSSILEGGITKLIFTGKDPGIDYLLNSGAFNRSARPQIEEVTFSNLVPGNTIFIDINNEVFSYFITENETITNLVNNLKSIINSSSLPITAGGTTTLILQHDVVNTPFESTINISDVDIDKYVTIKSGWNVFSTPAVLKAINFSNGNAEGLSFYSLNGGVWNSNSIAPTITNVKPLEGFMVYNNSDENVVIYLSYKDNLTPSEQIYQKNISAGWNLLGITNTITPFSTIGTKATAGIDFTNGTNSINKVSNFYSTTVGNANLNNLQIGESYGVFMSEDGIYGGTLFLDN